MSAERSPAQIRVVTAVVLVIVFLAGLATGAAVVHLTGGGPPGLGLPPMAALRGIDLTKDQRSKSDAIWARYKPQIDAILHESFPRVRAVDEQMSNELRTILTPDQQKVFDRNEADRPLGGPGFPPAPPPFGPRPGPGAPPPGGPGGEPPPPPAQR